MDSSHLLPNGAPPAHHTEPSSHDVFHDAESGRLKLQNGLPPPSVSNVTNYYGVGRRNARKTLVLCFDGTGNKFHGDSSDSNILKIFRMLDRSGGTGFHYYQPGIGTYVSSSSISQTGTFERLANWYKKAKDSAVGTTFDTHVIGGYKFLMNYYSPGDNIYMFGFSRGAYTARFLSEMLDWVGLITHGNDEMIQFAWRTFSQWKAMSPSGPESLKKQKKAYEFMVAFRETFSRPVRRIRFLGLFDTVNSVPRFENAMMRRRVHMPYSAKSSAKVIRHAVSIDERRAKFRSDLISPEGRRKEATDAAKAKHIKEKQDEMDKLLEWFHTPNRYKPVKKNKPALKVKPTPVKEYRDPIPHGQHGHNEMSHLRSEFATHFSEYRGRSQNRKSFDKQVLEKSKSPDRISMVQSIQPPDSDDESSDGDEEDQDIEELWFPGGHADIGGGWALKEGEVPLSHVPLVWIVREAKKTGLALDEEKMRVLGCVNEDEIPKNEHNPVPVIEVSVTSPSPKDDEKGMEQNPNGLQNGASTPALNSNGTQRGKQNFKDTILEAATKGMLHDCLEFGKGLPAASVASWSFMEWIPFRRMDLRPDGSWKPIRWPLPRGEVRDMPDESKVHHSAIKRMHANPDYRPGNLILGGGGRGVKRAPKSAGIGEWIVVKEEGDIVGEAFVRKKREEENGNTKEEK